MSNPAKLYVAFLWHMHQPFYKDFGTNKYILPWVRFHAIKDYYDMAAVIERFPDVKVTFNLVPSLLVQLEDLASAGATDIFWDLTEIPAAQLDEEAKTLILRNFFYCNWETMIKPYPRFLELLNKRGKYVTDPDLKKIIAKFSEQDFLDLTVWFNLAWFGYLPRSTDPFLKGLIEKGANFTEEDKKALLAKQKEIMQVIIPKYRELYQKGQIEISTTPFYHPILPVLLDARSAKKALPQLSLPELDINWPEDVKAQLYLATEYFTKTFGQPPKGMWPSEGSVSDDLVPYFLEQKLKWLATDEEILALSLGKPLSDRQTGRSLTAQELYRPYKIVRDNQEIAIFFRDHSLSDLIGFVYSKWDAKSAADDLVDRLKKIRDALPEGKGYLVAIILDGENAWEYYQNNGVDFLSALYDKLTKEPEIKTTTFSEYLKNFPVFQQLDYLYPGSWINHNFRIWIGDEEDNTAWDYLGRARSIVKEMSQTALPEDIELQKKLAAAWQEIFIAEGSDWYWWFGEDHSSAHDAEFDALFRRHLINIYHILDLEVPEYLNVPIKGAFKATRTSREPTFTIKPVLDGKVTSYYEWISAGLYTISGGRGTMHQASPIIKAIYYGFDLENLYFRMDFSENLIIGGDKKGICFCFNIFNQAEFKLELRCTEAGQPPVLELFKKSGRGKWQKVEELKSFAVAEIAEIAVPFSKLKVNRGEKLRFILVVEKDGFELETWPAGGFITIEVPHEDFEAEMWCA